MSPARRSLTVAAMLLTLFASLVVGTAVTRAATGCRPGCVHLVGQ